MRRQIEGDGKTLLTSRKVSAVEGVRFLRRRETCVLTHRPRTENVHRRVRSSEARRDAARKLQVVHMIVFIVIVERLDGNLLHRALHQRVIAHARRSFQAFAPIRLFMSRRTLKVDFREIRVLCHH